MTETSAKRPGKGSRGSRSEETGTNMPTAEMSKKDSKSSKDKPSEAPLNFEDAAKLLLDAQYLRRKRGQNPRSEIGVAVAVG